MKKSKIFALGLLLFLGLQLFMGIPFLSKQNVSADIDTLTLKDDFEEKYYNNIYSQYENATVTQNYDSVTLRPTGVGTTSQLTPIGDTTNWECVDEVIPDDDTTRVHTATGTLYDTYQTADHTTETSPILNVTIFIRCYQFYGFEKDYARTIIRSGGTDYYGSSITLTDSYIDYNTAYTLNPADNQEWEWTDIDNIEIGVELDKNDAVAPRCTQVYIIVYYDDGTNISSTTTHKQQDTSYYRAFGGLYSYFHNVTTNYTQFGETIKQNSSIIIDFVSLNVFPQGMTFFIYFNCFYNVSLFIGTEEYNLVTHDYSIDDWRYIDIRFFRSDYLLTDLNADFYIEIYPIENNNINDIFYMDNLAVKYTDPEPAISYRNWCHGGDIYDDWVTINDSSSSFYASGTGENPAGWLEDGTSDKWAYRTASNKVMSRGMTIFNAWTLHDWEVDNNLIIFTDINFTTDREYYISDVTYFYNNVGGGLSQVDRIVRLFIDNVFVYYNLGDYSTSISDSSPILDEYYDLSHKVELTQLNEHTMQYNSQFANLYTNITDWRPLIFSINEEIQVGFNIMRYAQQTQYQAGGSASTNPTIQQKTVADIHNTPISDLTIPDVEAGFFRTIWDRLMEYIGQATGIEGLLWQQLNLERAYQEALLDLMNDMIEGQEDWLDNYYEDIQDIQDTYAGGIVSTWRNLFSNNDYEGLEDRFETRWGGLFVGATSGGDSIFTKIFGNIFGEEVGIIPQLIWTFFTNFKAWIVIGFVMFIIMFMRAIMKRDYDRVMGITRGSISVILFIVQMVKWFIKFIIDILVMIGGFIPFT